MPTFKTDPYIADCNILKQRKQTSLQILYFLPSPVSSGDRKLKTKVRKDKLCYTTTTNATFTLRTI